VTLRVADVENLCSFQLSMYYNEGMINATRWFEPGAVIEILGAEITLGHIHTCAMDSVRKRSGLAIRFPRFRGKFRLDKAAEDPTTCAETVEMYRNQLENQQDGARASIRWNPNCDVTNNREVGGSGITIIAKDYGEFDPINRVNRRKIIPMGNNSVSIALLYP
jgi:hypothetical protein